MRWPEAPSHCYFGSAVKGVAHCDQWCAAKWVVEFERIIMRDKVIGSTFWNEDGGLSDG